jgi:histidinol phosphatase-like PHP family hydrolase
MDSLERLTISETKSTPYVDFNAETGHLVIKGASIAENPEEFYEPIYQWLEQYLKNPKPRTVAHFFFYFFNTSSAMRILEVFKILKRLYNAGKEIIIRWYMFKDDEDMQEAGEDYQIILEMPFEFVEVPDKDVNLLELG